MNLRERWKKFREFDERGLLIARVEGSKAYTKSGYVFNRWIFRAAFSVIIILIIFLAIQGYAWKSYYFKCPEDSFEPCRNPFISSNGPVNYCLVEDVELCSVPTLQPGEEYGPKPPFLVKHFISLWALTFLCAVLVNHFIYNKGKIILED